MSRPALQIVQLAECQPTPWRNGGGITHDLLTWPPDSTQAGPAHGAPAWQLRVSVATIDRNGPFSRFDGIQRCFCVLSGAGVRLQLPGGTVTLRPGDAPLAFDGAAAPGCELLSGPTQDLNLMAPRSAGRLAMRVATAGSTPGGTSPGTALRWCGLFTATTLTLLMDGQPHALPANSLAWADGPSTALWQIAPDDPAPSAWWLTLAPAAKQA